MSVHEHKEKGKKSIACFVLTVSDTRDEATDQSGQTIKNLIAEQGHRLAGYRIVKDEPAEIEALLKQALADGSVEAVIVNGGTGIAPRDTTYEALTTLLDKRLDGFGELFRMLSWEQVGAAAMLSRAAAGVARGKILVSLPGSPDAVGLAMDRLLVPELGHMAHLLEG
jgi:molybdopterin adenylyltransferase